MVENKNFQSSILKGPTDKSAMVTHNTIYYRPQTASRNNNDQNQALILTKGIKHPKGNAFKTISAENHYSSVSKLAYRNLGDPTQIKASLDEDRRLDLRRSHFKVGKEIQPMYSHNY